VAPKWKSFVAAFTQGKCLAVAAGWAFPELTVDAGRAASFIGGDLPNSKNASVKGTCQDTLKALCFVPITLIEGLSDTCLQPRDLGPGALEVDGLPSLLWAKVRVSTRNLLVRGGIRQIAFLELV